MSIGTRDIASEACLIEKMIIVVCVMDEQPGERILLLIIHQKESALCYHWVNLANDKRERARRRNSTQLYFQAFARGSHALALETWLPRAKCENSMQCQEKSLV
jgi:hypothetical protein